MPIIKKHFSDKVKDFEFAINNPQEYYTEMKKKVRELEKKYKLKVIDIVIHQELDLK
jgi:peptidyl-tRNA hydrolase